MNRLRLAMVKFCPKSALFLAFWLICASAQAEVRLLFSPYDDIESEWVVMIKNAEKEIKISCFGLTNESIYQALVQKKKEGVKILVCIDKRQSASSHDKKKFMLKNYIEVVTKKTTALEHNKMMVVDDTNAIMGSWNLSKNAQTQDNSVAIFINEPVYAAQIEHAINRIRERDTREATP